MKQKHKWAKEIKAWADGEQIQCRENSNSIWEDVLNPVWSTIDGAEYRIKPEPVKIKYRVALFKYIDRDKFDVMSYTPEHYSMVEENPIFVRWLTEETEIEV